jgi:hypothetical protein
MQIDGGHVLQAGGQMKSQRLFLTIILLASLLTVGIMFAGTTEAAPKCNGTPGCHAVSGISAFNLRWGGLGTSSLLDLRSLAASGCGFGQMVFLAPMGGLIWIAKKRKDQSN